MALIRWLSVESPRLWLFLLVALVVYWTTIHSVQNSLTWIVQESSLSQRNFDIPRQMWQIWLYSTKQPDRDWGQLSHTWIDLNKGWDYHYVVMRDSSAETYVQNSFKHRPDIVQAFTEANETIHKADFLRYLLLLEQGGVYSDLDTRCTKPIRDWIPSWYRDNTSLVIGIELNDYFEGNYDPGRPYIQLCQWTIMAKPQHRIMQKVVDSVTARLLGWEGEDVMEMTGPRVSRIITLYSIKGSDSCRYLQRLYSKACPSSVVETTKS